MSNALANVSFDGSPVQFRMDSPLLACFDPLALDLLQYLMPEGASFDLAGLLERANCNHPALACYTVPDFQRGVYTLDPRDIKKFGDEDENLDYREGEQASGDNSTDFLFVAVDSGTLIIADVAHVPKLVSLLTWEKYDRSLGDDTVFPANIERLGDSYFAVVVSDTRLGMQFDGDGTYTIAPSCVRRVSG